MKDHNKLRVPLRPEIELLLYCCRSPLEVDKSETIQDLISGGMDWEYLLKSGRKHGLMPLLYRRISTLRDGTVPADILTRLQGDFHQNSFRNLAMTRELLRLLNVFEMNSVPAIPFKGPTLADRLYGNLSLRHFVDLDMLVQIKDVFRIRELLEQAGYEPIDNMPAGKEAEFLRAECEYRFYHERKKVALEIHWEITPRYFSFRLDHESLWKEARPISFGGAEVLSLASEDLLLILSVHACKHLWDRLMWVCDVAELIRTKGAIDWSIALGKARQLGAERMLLIGLYLANDLIGVELPPEPFKRVQADRALPALAAKVREELFKEESGPPAVLKTVLFHLKVRERLSDRMRYCSRLGLTPNDADRAFMSLPSALTPLHYIWRFVRITSKYGSDMASRFRRADAPKH